jgi:hypothetical protein
MAQQGPNCLVMKGSEKGSDAAQGLAPQAFLPSAPPPVFLPPCWSPRGLITASIYRSLPSDL